MLVPSIGWTSNCHGYVFEDPNDGAVLGPKNSSDCLDMELVFDLYFDIMDDTKIEVGSILRAVGDECFYTYDILNQWKFKIIVRV